MSEERPLKESDDAAGRLLRAFDEETLGAQPPAARVRLLEGAEARIARPRRGPWLIAAAALAAAAAVAWVAFAPREVARLDAGALAVSGQGGLKAGDEVPLGVEVTAVGEVEVALGKRGRMKLAPGARCVLQRKWKVRCGAVELESIDASFSVAGDGPQLLVAVIDGSLQLQSNGALHVLTAGQSWPPPSAEPQRPPDAPSGVAPPEVAAPEPEAPPSTPEQRARAQARLSMLETAAKYLRQGKVAKARALYRELAAEEGGVAEIALYNLSRLEMQKARSPQAALEALDEQLQRFPNGALSREARLSRVEALRALGRKDEAVRASEEIRDAGLTR